LEIDDTPMTWNRRRLGRWRMKDAHARLELSLISGHAQKN
jgi:hypothetical protein